ncbi:ABC transporter ATP-binding protein [Noviherbaspirillum malthae]|uniref:ABC transporter ATP-binding protein n=1 Tax=Noviherbaspirillum malthae TaxID=1260987 RepID=UPI00188E2740|nr:ABC transporter ATP-binding protein [Noviherbaspirillum malthae]
MSEVLLQGKGLHSFYGQSHILHGVDFSIRRGETVGLMGRNGMGKSTLIKSLVGVVRPRQGEVQIRGRSTIGLPPFQVARMGVSYVPEGRGIFPNLNVQENLLVSARSGVDGRRDWTYERVLDSFPRLKERLHHGGHQLSGGEQQMLTIGRALMTNPDLLILDEATEGLAPLVSKEIWRIISLIREAGIATVIVDKNFKAVTEISSRNIIMVKGRVVFEGSGQELEADPARLKEYLGV